jgi:hypothetical protein
VEYGFGDVVQRVAYKLGLGYTAYASLPSANEKTLLTSIINSGYNLFVRPPLLQGMRRVHEWSFLKPIATINIWPSVSSTLDGAPVHDIPTNLSTVTVDDAMFYDNMVDEGGVILTIGSNEYTITAVTSTTVCVVTGDASGEVDEAECSVTQDGAYRLPAAFGAMVGPMTHAAESGYPPVNIRSETEIRRLRRWSTGTGVTSLAAIRPLTPSQIATQEFDLLVYPAPDTNYPLTYRYSVRLSEFDDTTNKVFPGAADHSELILQACLAVAEERTQDGRGPEYQAFMTHLAPAILFDREAHAAESFGVPGGRGVHSGMSHAGDIYVTVGGVLR